MAFEHVVPLRWRDTDALGHVNHAVFLTYLEAGRDALFAAATGGPMYVVARIELDFRAEVRLEAGAVTVRIEVADVGVKSLTTREWIILPNGVVAAEGRVVSVRWDRPNSVAVPFTDAERTELQRWAT